MKPRAELVVVMKGGRKQRNVRGAVLADKVHPPFTVDHDGYHLRWWGVDHPASKRIRELVKFEVNCPLRAWCLSTRIKISKRAMAHHRCAFEEHDQLYQCPTYRNDGHERPLDRGDVMARCAGAEFCGKEDCYHFTLHQWDPGRGCRDVHCRDLETALERWDRETQGPRPDIDAVITCEMME